MGAVAGEEIPDFDRLEEGHRSMVAALFNIALLVGAAFVGEVESEIDSERMLDEMSEP